MLITLFAWTIPGWYGLIVADCAGETNPAVRQAHCSRSAGSLQPFGWWI